MFILSSLEYDIGLRCFSFGNKDKEILYVDTGPTISEGLIVKKLALFV
jgi:hypothetical protein